MANSAALQCAAVIRIQQTFSVQSPELGQTIGSDSYHRSSHPNVLASQDSVLMTFGLDKQFLFSLSLHIDKVL